MKNSNMELVEVHRNMEVLAKDDEFGLSVEISDTKYEIDEFLKKSEIYQNLIKELHFKESQLKAMQEFRKVKEEQVLNFMIDSNLKELEVHGRKFKVQATSSVETILEDINEVPEEFTRVKVELDKVKAKKLYQETGVLIPGVTFEHKQNFKLKY